MADQDGGEATDTSTTDSATTDSATDSTTDVATTDKATTDGGEAAVNYFAKMPDNWRQNLVETAGYEGDDATKYSGQLERVLDMGTFAKNYFNAQDRIRTGELASGLPENATPEQMADWRTANGVPEAADKYELALDDGLVLGDDDTRIMAGVYEVAHAENVSSQTMSALTNAMMQGRVIEQDAMTQQDGVQQQQTVVQLKEAWGQDYTTNQNMVKGLIAQLPEAIREEFEDARLPDGRAMFNSPEIMVFFADVARKLNPAGTVVPNANNPTQAITDEIAALEGRMGDDDWHKDKAAQARIQQLYDTREQMKAS